MRRINLNLIFPLATIALLGGAMWAIHDRFIPIQEGWMQYYALMTQKGLLPYKDFYYFTQPIPLFIVELISKFGDRYMLYRYYGMIERSILVLALYYLIAKHFSPTTSFIAVVTSAFLYQGFTVDILYTYYQTTLLFYLLALICLERGRDSRQKWVYDGLVGGFASLAFFTKQSSGLLVSILLLFMLTWYTAKYLLAQRTISFLIGWAVPACAIIIWLLKEQIFSQYLGQVFGGTSSKGSIPSILFGFWGQGFALFYLGLFAFVSFILLLLWRAGILNIKVFNLSSRLPGDSNYLLPLVFLPYAAGGLLIPPNMNTAAIINVLGSQYLTLWLYFTFYLITIASVMIGIKWIFRKQLPFTKSVAELIVASFIWTYSTGLSGQLEVYAGLLGTALVLAFLIDCIQLNWKYYRLILISASCLVLFVSAARRNQILYDWWGWTEYGHNENAASAIPAFKGFNLSANTAEIYDKIYFDIENNTSPNDYVYTYPYMTLFNYVTGRMQPTFSPVAYFDVCPDSVAIADATRLKENPPKMIIYMEMPESIYKLHEEMFRNGQPSGQRNIDSAIYYITTRYNYNKIDSFVSPKWGWHIYVWLKP